MKAVVVGAGPVGCMAAMRFRERGWDVVLFDAGPDPRAHRRGRRRSINLTLSRRGLRTLPPCLRDILYERGVPCAHRVVHNVDRTMKSQPYGLTPDDHLLSISRELLNRLLVEQVERAGVTIGFERECVRVVPEEAYAMILSDGRVLDVRGDILVGCDGSNSIVRHEMSRRGARLNMSQEYVAHSYIELVVPPTSSGDYCWPEWNADGVRQSGLHVWPRGNFMLLALPNVDKTYTASLFVPTSSDATAEASFERLTTPRAVLDFFQRHFSDAVPVLPSLADDFLSATPSTLRTLKCSPYHHGRTVLLGDAAHTMVPFFGQGVNSGFEDVHELFELLDRGGSDDPRARVQQHLADFSAVRVRHGHAITDLSLGNFNELVDHSGTVAFQARHAIERELYRRSPQTFRPLLNMVSFADLSYGDVAQVHRRQAARLDELCRIFDPTTQADRIVQAYLDEHAGYAEGDGRAGLSN